ncbi:MAG: TIGR04282 family arsenosugar biosynthesis glycosyltransferase [Candidatus Omnitrophica bacterium]|nr:TIGR04282 family arsenosugar biosynthesis glycosyltransferase [Candidatus Omnitrophota bacterium]
MRSLIVFAKEPQKGKVKTRLLDCLSRNDCLKLYKAFLRDTLDVARAVNCEKKIIAYEATCEPRYIKRIGKDFSFYKQEGENFGERLINAFKAARKEGSQKIVVIGADSPTILSEFIERGFNLLDDNDIILGPTRDRGFYLIGLKNSVPGLFKNIQWSTNYVLAGILKNSEFLGKKVAKLDEWYDVDDKDSLLYLSDVLKHDKNIRVARWTKKTLRYCSNSFWLV